MIVTPFPCSLALLSRVHTGNQETVKESTSILPVMGITVCLSYLVLKQCESCNSIDRHLAFSYIGQNCSALCEGPSPEDQVKAV